MSGAALALTSTVVIAQNSPESLLPPGVGSPSPSPSPAPTPAPRPAETAAPAPAEDPDGAVVQPLPTATAPAPVAPVDTSGVDLDDIPSVRELESMSTSELDELFGLKPKSDIPPAARRSTERVGLIDPQEGGLPTGSLANQPAPLVRAALEGLDGEVVSRWGHILLRRALASRLAAPEGMDPVEFAALRTRALNRMGEHAAARALAQDVDTVDYTNGLLDAAIDAYVGTGDIVGACPAVRLARSGREDERWRMLESICAAYAGEAQRAQNELRRLQSRTEGDPIDVLLAQRFAGAAGEGRRAVTIEWDDIEDMTPWRFALANALGEPIPENLAARFDPYFLKASATIPALPFSQRLRGADVAASSGILSSSALVDLYSQIYADREQIGEDPGIATAARLRAAYVEPTPAGRLAAIRDIWGDDDDAYGRLVLTAYATARLTPIDDAAEDAGRLVASMLTAGLERDALRWSELVDEGSLAWAQLVLANPDGDAVSGGDFDSFAGDDTSAGQRKAQMLLAGLAGLGRMDEGDVGDYASDLGVSLAGETAWTRQISAAARVENRALVALLAGLGMQGDDWEQMTARHLYHIVSALNRVGLEAEARMIAAEAVARA